MSERNAIPPEGLHPRNPHRGRYDFEVLGHACPELLPFLRSNPAGDQTIDFGDAEAVRCLNRALLADHYGIEHWQIPSGYLCPPIPGRADYVHHLADLLAIDNDGRVPNGAGVRVLDIGTGANLIYPIIGHRSYGWHFVGADIDPEAIHSAEKIRVANPELTDAIRLVHQDQRRSIFSGVIETGERYDLTMCNPPFHASAEEAQRSNRRKVEKLNRGGKRSLSAGRNFGGQSNELWCPGGELKFLKRMIKESEAFADQVGWFTSLVSKSDHLGTLLKRLKNTAAVRVEVVEMSQGHKKSRFMAWSFRG